jgi:hypothetical protein
MIVAKYGNYVRKFMWQLWNGVGFISRVQMKSWAGKALEIVNCCAFLKRRLIGAC